MGPRQAEYAEGRAHGTQVCETESVEAADAIVEWLQAIDDKALYMIAFRRSVNDFVVNHTI